MKTIRKILFGLGNDFIRLYKKRGDMLMGDYGEQQENRIIQAETEINNYIKTNYLSKKTSTN